MNHTPPPYQRLLAQDAPDEVLAAILLQGQSWASRLAQVRRLLHEEHTAMHYLDVLGLNPHTQEEHDQVVEDLGVMEEIMTRGRQSCWN